MPAERRKIGLAKPEEYIRFLREEEEALIELIGQEGEKLMAKIGGDHDVFEASVRLHAERDLDFRLDFVIIMNDWAIYYKSAESVDLALLKEVWRFHIEIFPGLLERCPPIIKSDPNWSVW